MGPVVGVEANGWYWFTYLGVVTWEQKSKRLRLTGTVGEIFISAIDVEAVRVDRYDAVVANVSIVAITVHGVVVATDEVEFHCRPIMGVNEPVDPFLQMVELVFGDMDDKIESVLTCHIGQLVCVVIVVRKFMHLEVNLNAFRYAEHFASAQFTTEVPHGVQPALTVTRRVVNHLRVFVGVFALVRQFFVVFCFVRFVFHLFIVSVV